MKFVTEVESSAESFSDLCAGYGVSRVTGYKWLERYEEEGAEGLWERSRAPRPSCARAGPGHDEVDIKGAPCASQVGTEEIAGLAGAQIIRSVSGAWPARSGSF